MNPLSPWDLSLTIACLYKEIKRPMTYNIVASMGFLKNNVASMGYIDIFVCLFI